MYSEKEKEVLAMEEARRAALVAHDMEALSRLFAEDYVHVHSNTLEHSKAEIIAHIDKKRAFVDCTRENLRVKVMGDGAVLFGKITNFLKTPDGIYEMKGWVTQVLRKDNGVWQFINFQFTKEAL